MFNISRRCINKRTSLTVKFIPFVFCKPICITKIKFLKYQDIYTYANNSHNSTHSTHVNIINKHRKRIFTDLQEQRCFKHLNESRQYVDRAPSPSPRLLLLCAP